MLAFYHSTSFGGAGVGYFSFHFFSGMKRNETKKNPARINSLSRGLMLLFQLG
jgi:hypothetical protein